MKPCSRLGWIALAVSIGVPALAQNAATTNVYVRSNINQPWGQSTNEDAMDSVFGADNWTTLYFEDLTAASLFTSSTKFIFMEGGDTSFASFQDFMQSYESQAYSWIQNGGRLLIMCAPNDPLNSAVLGLPDNVVLHADAFYNSAASTVRAVDLSNPIFSSPHSTTNNLNGDFVAHGYFTGSDVRIIMKSNFNQTVLGLDTIGSGLMMFGGMTTDNFHLPQPSAHALLENIIYYTAYTSLD
jgi:hypothetical protein